jgi:hypothetical protein
LYQTNAVGGRGVAIVALIAERPTPRALVSGCAMLASGKLNPQPPRNVGSFPFGGALPGRLCNNSCTAVPVCVNAMFFAARATRVRRAITSEVRTG